MLPCFGLPGQMDTSVHYGGLVSGTLPSLALSFTRDKVAVVSDLDLQATPTHYTSC